MKTPPPQTWYSEKIHPSVFETLPQRVAQDPAMFFLYTAQTIGASVIAFSYYKDPKNSLLGRRIFVVATATYCLLPFHWEYDLSQWTKERVNLGKWEKLTIPIPEISLLEEKKIGDDELEVVEYLPLFSEEKESSPPNPSTKDKKTVHCRIATKEGLRQAIIDLALPFQDGATYHEKWETVTQNFLSKNWGQCWRDANGNIPLSPEDQSPLLLRWHHGVPMPDSYSFCAIPTSLLPKGRAPSTIWCLWQSEGEDQWRGYQCKLEHVSTGPSAEEPLGAKFDNPWEIDGP